MYPPTEIDLERESIPGLSLKIESSWMNMIIYRTSITQENENKLCNFTALNEHVNRQSNFKANKFTLLNDKARYIMINATGYTTLIVSIISFKIRNAFVLAFSSLICKII